MPFTEMKDHRRIKDHSLNEMVRSRANERPYRKDSVRHYQVTLRVGFTLEE
jgi:flavin-binding protein dodecin